ncbi:MAG: PAS domain S-box protein [Desulfobacula sp.]|nr:PAS domain S-box protein [Desulfobacula sp.]
MEIKFVEKQIQQIQNSYLKSITKSAWNMETDEVTLQLEGALQLRDITYLEVKTEIGDTLASTGTKSSQKIITHILPLEYRHHGKLSFIGELHVIASLDGLYQRLYDKIIVIMGTRLLLTFFMSGFFLFIFHHFVSRHLTTIAKYAQSLDLNNPGSLLTLNRSFLKSSDPDELENVVNAINEMQLHIQEYISAIKNTEKALRKEKAFTETALNAQKDTFFLFESSTGKAIRWNRTFNVITGYTNEEIAKMVAPDSYYSPEDLKRASIFMEEIEKTGAGTIELDLICKNNHKVPTEYNATVLKDEDGKSKYLISVGRDVTERNQAEKKLKKSEKQYRTLFEKINDAIFIVEKSTGHYLDGNKAAMKLTGRTLEELKQVTCHEVTPEITDEKFQAIAKSDETRELGAVTFYRSDNTFRIARLSTVPLDNNAVIGIARDITHDLELEKQLRQSHKMEAIGTLAGGIAHDFNNILSSIFGYAQLAEMSLKNPDKARKNIKQVVNGAQRAAELVQQILTFSRRAEYNKHSLKLSNIVKEAIKFLRSSIPATIAIEEKISSQAMVLADPTMAHQVIMNLCTNAYHAMLESGGTLTVELVDFEITSQNHFTERSSIPGNYVKLEVRDTGHGMDRKTLERIFDPYYTTKKTDKGTGLGLAVVDGIVKKHNGFTKIYSEVGHGSTFQVFWPVTKKKDALNIPIKKNTDFFKGNEQIMLVDDEVDILDTSRTILEQQGYKVATFKDGLSALQAFKLDPDFFDIVITDMTMPKMAGDELSVEILKIRKDIPIILCTGYHESFTEDNARDIGISQYVQKPITGQELSALIRGFLDKKIIAAE